MHFPETGGNATHYKCMYSCLPTQRIKTAEIFDKTFIHISQLRSQNLFLFCLIKKSTAVGKSCEEQFRQLMEKNYHGRSSSIVDGLIEIESKFKKSHSSRLYKINPFIR